VKSGGRVVSASVSVSAEAGLNPVTPLWFDIIVNEN